MGVLFVSLGAILFGTTYLVGETHIIGVTTKKKPPKKFNALVYATRGGKISIATDKVQNKRKQNNRDWS